MVLSQAIGALHHPMPGRVRHQRRENDGPHALRHNPSEQQFQSRDQQHQYQELSQLDPDIERQQRRQQVGAGKLQRLPESERETEAVDQAEAECDDPSSPYAGASGDVLERHVDDGHGDQSLDERRKPQRVRAQAVGGSDQRHGMCHGERGDQRDQRPEAAEGKHQAKQE